MGQQLLAVLMVASVMFSLSVFLCPVSLHLKQELEKLLQEKETVFYFLGQHLFHPTNVVWGLITRYYHAYLARADRRMGTHIEVSDTRHDQFQQLVEHILACGIRHELLPEVEKQRSLPSSKVLNRKSKGTSCMRERSMEPCSQSPWSNGCNV
ncbi:hypothetical protein N665_0076s0378 [Sinapis alba]|nr:hypothetical protein N665_0076s0378 [Sinapis alba]